MTWTLYRWVWRLCLPLHIGATPAGSLNRTRLYIPARALWGALTAEIARRRYPGSPDYQQTGKDLSENCRFSYLFPAQQVNRRWLAWLPRYEEGQGLVWRREDKTDAQDDVSDRVFRSRLLTTRLGTAIDHDSATAAEGKLWEYEVINPWSHWGEKKNFQPVAFVGYVFVSEGVCLDILKIKEIFIGGDTRYGLGRMQNVECREDTTFFGNTVQLTENDPIVMTDHLLAHTLPDRSAAFWGALEQLAMWDYGKLFMTSCLTWVPGSKAQSNCILWRILKDGLWERTQGSNR